MPYVAPDPRIADSWGGWSRRPICPWT